MTKPAGEIQDCPTNGLTYAYLGLAYNLYLLEHNAELQAYLVRRLKHPDTFYAAYYETHVAAWFILAGFTLAIENEEDSTRTHVEFIATRDGRTSGRGENAPTEQDHIRRYQPAIEGTEERSETSAHGVHRYECKRGR